MDANFWKMNFLQIGNEQNFTICKMLEKRQVNYIDQSITIFHDISYVRKPNDDSRHIIQFESPIEPQNIRDITITEKVPFKFFDGRGPAFMALFRPFYIITFPINNPLEESDPLTYFRLWLRTPRNRNDEEAFNRMYKINREKMHAQLMSHTLLKSNIPIHQDSMHKILGLVRTIPFPPGMQFPEIDTISEEKDEEEQEEETNEEEEEEEAQEEENQQEEETQEKGGDEDDDDTPYLKWRDVDAKRRAEAQEWKRRKQEEEQKLLPKTHEDPFTKKDDDAGGPAWKKRREDQL